MKFRIQGPTRQSFHCFNEPATNIRKHGEEREERACRNGGSFGKVKLVGNVRGDRKRDRAMTGESHLLISGKPTFASERGIFVFFFFA